MSLKGKVIKFFMKLNIFSDKEIIFQHRLLMQQALEHKFFSHKDRLIP